MHELLWGPLGDFESSKRDGEVSATRLKKKSFWVYDQLMNQSSGKIPDRKISGFDMCFSRKQLKNGCSNSFTVVSALLVSFLAVLCQNS